MMSAETIFNSIEDAIEAISQGEMIIVIDDEDRENEGDFVMAAEKVTPEAINFMATVGRGLICAPIEKEKAQQLQLEMMVKNNDSIHNTAFTVSIDIDNGSTGISAHDRFLTLSSMAKENVESSAFVKPGHIFPLIARDGGVLERNGHTEASIDLCKLAKLSPVGVICEIMNPDGTMARTANLIEIAKEHKLKIITIKDLIEYLKREKL